MKKRRIVLASILKPIYDTRMYEKLALTLATNPTLEVHVIGYPSDRSNPSGSIHFHPLKSFSRISFGRLLAPLKVLLLTYQVKPEVLIVTSHELLIVSFLNRIFFGAKIVYDVQENYAWNILHSGSFSTPIKYLIAAGVRFKEVALAPTVHRFILAEKGYQKELKFIRDRFTILENKCSLKSTGELSPLTKKEKSGEKIRLLFTGTLSESTGVFQAVELAKSLHQIEPKIELTIIGFAALKSVQDQLIFEVQNHSFIRLIGGTHLVPHDEILEAIRIHDFGIISYPLSPHIQNSIPTKLYEYLTYRLPILLQNHPPWLELCEPSRAAIILDFQKFQAREILTQMSTQKFYTHPPKDTTWESEAPHFQKLMQDLLV